MSTLKHVWRALVLAFVSLTSYGQARTWEIGVAGGAVYNARTPLRIHQEGAETIRLNARYKTDPFSSPVYYDVRINSWKASKGLGLKFTHHKLTLQTPPPDVQHFSITDGFNLLTLNRLWLQKGIIWSLGGGIVITHPESTVRNKAFPENRGIFNKGYYISGPTLEAAVAKQYYFTNAFFLFGEGRATASYVRVPVSNGHANVTNLALHILFGVGFKLTNPEKNQEG